MSEPKKCVWCGKQRRKFSDWEQQDISTKDWKLLCNPCANRKLNKTSQPFGSITTTKKRRAMSEPTQQQKCAELAKAMYPTAEVYTSKGICNVLIAEDRKPDDTWEEDYTAKTLRFDPYTDHEACHALLAAMVSEDSEIDSNEIVFLSELMKNCPYLWQPGKLEFNAGEVRSIIFRALTADPATIAEAAWQSIQPAKQETT